MAAAVAVLGTGLLGAGFVRGFLKRNHPVHCWNRSASKAQALEVHGAKAFASPADAVRGVKYVHLVVAADAAVEEVLEAARSGLDKGTLVIDHSTVSPMLVIPRFERLRALGISYVSAPVFMGPDSAVQATGTMLVSCSQEVYDQVKDHLKTACNTPIYMGSERLDRAAALKLTGNNFALLSTCMMHDLLSVQVGLGLAPTDVMSILNQCVPAHLVVPWVTQTLIDAPGGFAKPMFELVMARKDVRLFQEAAAHTQSTLIVVPGMAAHMDRLIEQGHGNKEFLVIGLDISERLKARAAVQAPAAAVNTAM